MSSSAISPMTKNARHQRIIDLVTNHAVRSQTELAELLAQHGPTDSSSASAALEGTVLYCAAGSRSASAQQVLAGRGISVRSLRGGFGAVEGSGIAVTLPE